MLVKNKGNLTGKQKLILTSLLILPLLVMLGKWPQLPTSEFLMRNLSLSHLSAHLQNRVSYILFVPFGATVVVFFRLCLGIRLLGPFRSILIAVAFQATGILPGLVFLALVIAAVLVIRPLIKAIRLPLFARVSVILSAVASIMLIAVLMSSWLDVESLRQMAYFPIVVLCLISEGFAKTLRREGMGSAMWRGGMTALVAVLIALLFEMSGIRGLFLDFPEILVLEVGIMIAIAEFFDFRLLAWLNPRVSNKRRFEIRDSKFEIDSH